MNHYAFIALALPFIFNPTSAQDATCRSQSEFYNYNSTKTLRMPALEINRTQEEQQYFSGRRGGLITSDSSSWYITARVNELGADNGALSETWINTDNSNTTDIGLCIDRTSPSSLGTYAFSKEVLERSQNDNGDCKIMLGEDCVAALSNQYAQYATRAMLKGSCPSNRNNTVPRECADLVGGGEAWLGGGFSTLNLTTNPAAYLENKNCSTQTPSLNASMHIGAGTGDGYDNTIRFPQLWFMSFWPNRTGVTEYVTSWNLDVHVEIRCIRPDDVREGSVVPPSAQELLNRDGAEFHKNATTPKTSGASPSAGGAGTMRLLAPYLGAAVMAALLLM